MKDYEINDSTLAILPLEGENFLDSLVLEEEDEIDVERTPFEILSYSCSYFGSSYLGRREGSKNILNSAYKLPILIEDSKNLVFLPTNSPEEANCAWIALNKIKEISKATMDKNSCLIEFLNGKTMVANISYKSLENQILRASRLESVVRNRKQNKNF